MIEFHGMKTQLAKAAYMQINAERRPTWPWLPFLLAACALCGIVAVSGCERESRRPLTEYERLHHAASGAIAHSRLTGEKCVLVSPNYWVDNIWCVRWESDPRGSQTIQIAEVTIDEPKQ